MSEQANTRVRGRRLTAILAADIAGYSALMQKNEIETVASLKGHQSVILPMIAGFDGHVIDTAGDGVLAEFASVLNAVKCAVAIQETMLERNASLAPERRMQFRIGINQGDVLFDGERIFGDGINIAARLETLCAPGSICISRKVYDEIKGRFEIRYESLGPQRLKNISEPVHAYQISVSDVASSTRRKLPPIFTTKRNGYLMTGGAVTILAVIGLPWWFSSKMFQSSDIAKTSDLQSFDGIWEFTASGGQHCPVPMFTFNRRLAGGLILSRDGQTLGRIANDGRFQFSNPSPMSPSITVMSNGRIHGNVGEGSYKGLGTLCEGVYKIRLLSVSHPSPSKP